MPHKKGSSLGMGRGGYDHLVRAHANLLMRRGFSVGPDTVAHNPNLNRSFK